MCHHGGGWKHPLGPCDPLGIYLSILIVLRLYRLSRGNFAVLRKGVQWGCKDASDGLMYYGARYYEGYLNRWTQPDSIIPDWYNPQSLNRYSYGLNNPVKYRDPSGHFPIDWLIDIGSI